MEKTRYDRAFERLAKSRFRSRFHLSGADREYVAEKGMEVVRRHCADFVRTRFAPADPPDDGKQTPMRGHPVFKAQHACACCCRGCLAKWECARAAGVGLPERSEPRRGRKGPRKCRKASRFPPNASRASSTSS